MTYVIGFLLVGLVLVIDRKLSKRFKQEVEAQRTREDAAVEAIHRIGDKLSDLTEILRNSRL
jgi:hypothetical protein